MRRVPLPGQKKGGKIGLFEAADGGTLFLDEVSEMDISLQSKLLRALQERRVRPVGAVKEADVDVRVIAACNADLNSYVAQGKFRRDLYYRLNTFPIHIPPLRERPGDIPALTEVLLSQLAHKLRRPLRMTDEAQDALLCHSWPGNVRELRNVLEFAAYLSPDGTIRRESLPGDLLRRREGEPLTLVQRVKEFERREVMKAVERHGSTTQGKRAAAAELGISLASLYNKLSGE